MMEKPPLRHSSKPSPLLSVSSLRFGRDAVPLISLLLAGHSGGPPIAPEERSS